MTEKKDALEKKKKDDLAPVTPEMQGFELVQRKAMMLSKSNLAPKDFQGNVGNCVIALEMADRLGANVMAVMQNIYIVHGKPSWSSQFIIAAVNSTKSFSPIRYEVSGEGKSLRCVAWAIEKATGERLEGPAITMDMAEKEGWVKKAGSKWQTMPELMIRYRAATLFGRLYAPEILMGMQTEDEVTDVGPAGPSAEEVADRFAEPKVTEAEVVPEESEDAAKVPPIPHRDELMSEINVLNSKDDIRKWELEKAGIIKDMSKGDQDMIDDVLRMRKAELEELE